MFNKCVIMALGALMIGAQGFQNLNAAEIKWNNFARDDKEKIRYFGIDPDAIGYEGVHFEPHTFHSSKNGGYIGAFQVIKTDRYVVHAEVRKKIDSNDFMVLSDITMDSGNTICNCEIANPEIIALLKQKVSEFKHGRF